MSQQTRSTFVVTDPSEILEAFVGLKDVPVGPGMSPLWGGRPRAQVSGVGRTGPTHDPCQQLQAAPTVG